MALSTTQLRALLDPDEPDYARIKGLLGPGDVQGLLALVNGPDPMLASKATYAISLIHDPAAVKALEEAAQSPHEVVRVASASGLRNLGGLKVEQVAGRLLADQDPGVRKLAIKTAGLLKLKPLTPKLQEISKNDREPGLRALAQEVLEAG